MLCVEMSITMFYLKGESSERVGDLTNFPLWKIVDFFYKE